LKKIAGRSGEPALAYATDEDCLSNAPDPTVNRFDLGKDLLEFGRLKAKLVAQLLPGIVERMTAEGDDYTQARRAFNVLLSKEGDAMQFVSRYVGGLNTSRSHKGDKDAQPPLAVVDPQRQRDALALLEQEVFGVDAYQFPPDLLNHLGPTRWKHWGVVPTERPDYPIHDMVTKWQTRSLGHLMSSVTLERIVDNEMKVPADQDAFTAAELLERLTKAIFSEVDTIKEGKFTNRKPAIRSVRRNLQRDYFQRLALLALGKTTAPADCAALARSELVQLKQRIGGFLKGKAELDSYTRAHLSEMYSRIDKVEDAGFVLVKP
jgi:hypothetical protein